MEEIVLTTDKSLMSNFKWNYWFGFFSCLPVNYLPFFVSSFMIPEVKSDKKGRAKIAPSGLRKAEATIIVKLKEKVSIVVPSKLKEFINKKTRIVGVHVMDPEGLSPVALTIKHVLPYAKQSYSTAKFRELMELLKDLKHRYNFKILIGGPGAWQLATERKMEEYGIDCVFLGEVERTLPHTLQQLLDGNDVKKVVMGEIVPAEEILPIKGPTINGVVEISRGCGRNCKFCTEAMKGKMRCVPISTIKEEAKVNLKGGIKNLLLQSENFLDYGSNDFYPNESVIELYKELFNLGARSIQPIHANISSIACVPEFIDKFTSFLKKHGIKINSCQIGLETGSDHLIKKLMPGKLLPFKNEEWQWVVKEGFKVMEKNGWVPLNSLIMGLPGEDKDDIKETIELICQLSKYKKAMFLPLFYFSYREGKGECINEKLNMKLFHLCWKHNLRVAPKLLALEKNVWVKVLLKGLFRVVQLSYKGWMNATIRKIIQFLSNPSFASNYR